MSLTHLPFVKVPPPPTLAQHDKTLEIVLTALVGKELYTDREQNKKKIIRLLFFNHVTAIET